MRTYSVDAASYYTLLQQSQTRIVRRRTTRPTMTPGRRIFDLGCCGRKEDGARTRTKKSEVEMVLSQRMTNPSTQRFG